jgi:DNA end-binding protein Ku
VNKDELKLSVSLVETMSSKLSEIDLTDRYKDALKELIEAKIAGREVVVSVEEEKPMIDIMTALKQSIEATKAKKKPMERAKGDKKGAEKAPVEVVVEAAPVIKAKKRKAA